MACIREKNAKLIFEREYVTKYISAAYFDNMYIYSYASQPLLELCDKPWFGFEIEYLLLYQAARFIRNQCQNQ